MPTSITFSGNDNTQYTGTLYLHPLVNSITFTYPNSVIRNINFPNSIPNTGSDKDTVPFIKSNKPRTLTISIPFNIDNSFDAIDKLTIPGNTTINLSNIEKTKQYKFQNKNKNKPLNIFFNGKTEQSSDLKILNISNEEYVPIEYVEPTITINADYIISAKFDYNQGESGKCIYHYPTTIKCDCNNEIPLYTINALENLLTNDEILSTLGNVKCDNCKNKTIKPNVVLHSYLYPKSHDIGIVNYCNLDCSICNENSYLADVYVTFENNNYNGYSNYKLNWFKYHNLSHCKLSNNDNLKSDPDYVLEQLNKAHQKGLL